MIEPDLVPTITPPGGPRETGRSEHNPARAQVTERDRGSIPVPRSARAAAKPWPSLRGSADESWRRRSPYVRM
jgi:hypothetical protein